MSQPEEIRLDAGWGALSGLAWRRPGRPRALCLHGWMDNAASFEPLASQLDDLDLVALEFAGHGHSDHLPPGAQYYFANHLYDVDAVLAALGWDHCGLIGHSLGAGIAGTYACAAPERVDWVAMVDGLGALAEPPEAVRKRIGKSLASVRKPKSHGRVYPAVADAARTRQANNPMEPASARLLAERALKPSGGGYQWRTDGRLLWHSPVLMSEDQALALLAGIQCPVLSLTTGVLAGYLGGHLQGRLDAIADLHHESIEGGHHVHLDDPGPVAEHISSFLSGLGERQ